MAPTVFVDMYALGSYDSHHYSSKIHWISLFSRCVLIFHINKITYKLIFRLDSKRIETFSNRFGKTNNFDRHGHNIHRLFVYSVWIWMVKTAITVNKYVNDWMLICSCRILNFENKVLSFQITILCNNQRHKVKMENY